MTPAVASRRLGGERSPLSPMKPQTSVPQTDNVALFFEVPAFPGMQDKENSSSWLNTNGKIVEEDVPSKPILINLDVEDTKPAPSKKPASLGRPPKMCEMQQKPAQKVRLCSELARDGLIPACVVALMACIMAAAHSDEDHSYSVVKGAIASAIEDLYDGECWMSWLMFVSVVLLVVIGLICTYICHSAASSARPKKEKERKSLKEDKKDPIQVTKSTPLSRNRRSASATALSF